MKLKTYQYYGRRKGSKLSRRKLDVLKTVLPKLELNKKNIDEYILEIAEKKINVSLEIGFGSGENLLNMINNNDSDRNFVGCEPYLNGLASFICKLEEKKYNKIKLFKNDIRELLFYFSKNIFDEIFILFPDPWPKARHEKRRIINRENINLFLSRLRINGKIFVATDVKNYFEHIHKLFESLDNIKIINKDRFNVRPKDIISTKYEKKALIKNIRPYYLEVKKILD